MGLDHLDAGQLEAGGQILQKGGFSLSGLYQGKRHLRPGQLQHQPGETAAAAQVHHRGGAVQKRQHRQGVQKVLDDDIPVGLERG